MSRATGLLLGSASLFLTVTLAPAGEVHWNHLQLDSTFRSEGVATADVNHDGKIDVLAGDVWYEAPNWQMHEIRIAKNYDFARGYSECFSNFAYDVDGDGWKDQITIGFPGKPCHWYRNPQGRSGHWQQFEIYHSACNESPNFTDVNDDGKPDLILGADAQLGFLTFSAGEDATSPWAFHRVAPTGDPAKNGSAMFYHGLGTGDLNRDGHRDILIPHGWYEAPSAPGKHSGPWQFHAFRLSKHPEEAALKTAHLFVYDLDLDGDQDIITSSAHNFGIWWFENLGVKNHTRFQYHLIDESFSQTHALQMADINGDGHQDLITGKRFFAHNGKDPGGKDPVVMVWIEVERTKNSPPTFTLHEIPAGRNTGPGTQFEVRDMNNDHRIDIILSNKKGVHLLLQDETTPLTPETLTPETLTPETLTPENNPAVPQVGCAGILVVDTICGPVKALPEPGQLAILDDIPSTVGGCAANVAGNLAKQGVAVGVAGLVGEDSAAEFLRGELAARHVDCTQVKSTADHPTSQTVVLLIEGQDRRFLHSFGTNRFFSVLQLDREWIRNLKVFYVGGLFAMPNFRTDELAALLKYCRAHNVVTVVDVVVSQDMRDFGQLDECLPHVDYFLPNDDEATRITGQSDPSEQARAFRDKGVETTIVTLGEKGALAMSGDDLWRVGTFPVEFVDMTGCGDAFDAGLISGVLKNWDLPRMLSYATALGGSCAQAVGAYDGVFTAEEAENFLQTRQVDVEHMTIP